MTPYEQKIREQLIVDDTSPSGLRWNQLAISQLRGKQAGTMEHGGYWRVVIKIQGKPKLFRAHRLIFFLINGRWPLDQIDHINGNKSDNRLENLREASGSENCQNTTMRNDNTSSIKGVYFRRDIGKWAAQLMHQNKPIWLGVFAEIAEAESAVRYAREKLHGEFANHGIARTKGVDE